MFKKENNHTRTRKGIDELISESGGCLLMDKRLDVMYTEPSLRELSVALADRYQESYEVATFIKFIRRCFINEHNHFRYDLSAFSGWEKEKVIEVAGMLNANGLLYQASVTGSMLKGNVNLLPQVVGYLSGGFFEIAVYERVREVLEALAADFELIPNAVVQHGNDRREYDLLFTLDNKLFLVEAKSGNVVFNRGADRGKLLNVYPDRMVMVCGDRTEAEASNLSFFYGYRITTYASIAVAITEMIR